MIGTPCIVMGMYRLQTLSQPFPSSIPLITDPQGTVFIELTHPAFSLALSSKFLLSRKPIPMLDERKYRLSTRYAFSTAQGACTARAPNGGGMGNVGPVPDTAQR